MKYHPISIQTNARAHAPSEIRRFRSRMWLLTSCQ